MGREQLIRHAGFKERQGSEHTENEKLEGKMWCEQALWPVKTDKVEMVEHSASTVVTAQSHGMSSVGR